MATAAEGETKWSRIALAMRMSLGEGYSWLSSLLLLKVALRALVVILVTLFQELEAMKAEDTIRKVLEVESRMAIEVENTAANLINSSLGLVGED